MAAATPPHAPRPARLSRAPLRRLQSIVTAAGFSPSAASNINVILAGVKLLSTIASAAAVDRAGRRPLLMCGIAIMVVASLMLTIGYSTLHDGALSGGWAAIVVTSLFIYVIGYQIGFGPITWLLISEVFPLRTRGRAFALATTANFAVNLTVALVNPPLTESLGQARSH